MKHPERIEDYLQHIAEAIDRITGYVQGIDNAAALNATIRPKLPSSVISRSSAKLRTEFRNRSRSLLPPILRCRGPKCAACAIE